MSSGETEYVILWPVRIIENKPGQDAIKVEYLGETRWIPRSVIGDIRPFLNSELHRIDVKQWFAKKEGLDS